MAGGSEPMSNPYVGPRAFEEGEAGVFYGRDEEIAILEGLVMARRASLLFAQSGAGKSSLLRAGLIPELTRQKTLGSGARVRVYQKMRVLPVASVGGAIRDDIPAQNIYVLSALSSLRPDIDAAGLADCTLTDGLVPLFTPEAAESAAQTPGALLLIFDQFEELFTHHPDRWPDREGFFRQVAAALEGYPDLHVLFSMREDYIAELTPYAGLLPEELRPRFRLERLDRANALKAVILPAVRAGRTYAPGVAEALVDNLRRSQTARAKMSHPGLPGELIGAEADGYVEPVHLQIVCRQLWASLPSERTVIEATDVQEFGDVDQALTGFYESAVALVVHSLGTSERRVRAWFDEHLITPAHTRGLAYRGEQETEGMANAAVDILNDVYIIRASMRGGDTWYELAHDRLVEPILAANHAWLAAYRNPLAAAALEWQRAGRDERHLLRGVALEDARAFAADHAADVLEDEATYLAESIRQAQAAARRRRNVIIAIAAVMLALSGLTIWALRNAAEAQRNAAAARASADEARRQEGLSRSRELAAAAVANLDVDPEQSIFLTLQALNTTYTQEAEDALHRALQASRIERNLVGHTGAVHDVAYSPDGKRIATAGADGTARIFDAGTGRELMSLTGHNAMVYAVAFSPDGDQAATAGFDGTARIWDAQSGRQLAVLGGAEGHQGQVLNLAYNPDGTLLATTGNDRTARLWDVTSGRLVRTLAGHSDDVLTAAFNPDGTQLVTGSRDQSAIVWDVATGERLLTLAGHNDAISDVAYSPDGAQIATASWDETARTWDAETGDPLLTLFGHSNWVRGVAFSPDGKRLATSSWDRTAKVWDAELGRELMTLAGHKGWLQGLAFSPDGAHLATAGEDGVAKVWNVGPSRELLAFLPHDGAAVRGLARSPDGALLATVGQDGGVKLWDAVQGGLVRTLPGHAMAARDVAFGLRCTGQTGSECTPILATGSEDRTAQVWDATTGDPVSPAFDQNVTVTGVAISPDGTRLATSGSDGNIRVWQIGSVAASLVINGHDKKVANNVVFSPDGRWLATSGGDKAAKVWDAATGALVHTLAGHDGEVYYVAFSPDGKRLATAGVDQTVKVWDAASGQELRTLAGHTDRVTAVAFSPDGKRLATASWDRTAKVWDVESGGLMLTLVGPTNKLLDLTFSSDGRRLIIGGEDGTVGFYLLDIELLKALARQRIARQLSADECRWVFGEAGCGGTPDADSTQ